MKTKNIDKIWIDKDEYRKFKNKKFKTKVNFIINLSKNLEKEIEEIAGNGILVIKDRDLIYDYKQHSIFPLFSMYKGVNLRYDDTEEIIIERIKKHYDKNIDWNIGNLQEIKGLFEKNNNILLDKERLIFWGSTHSKIGYFSNKLGQGTVNNFKESSTSRSEIFNLSNKNSKKMYESTDNARAIPIFRVGEIIKSTSFLYNLMILGLIPEGLKSKKDFLCLQKIVREFKLENLDFKKINRDKFEDYSIEGYKEIKTNNEIIGILILEDKIRADIKEYNPKVLEDVNSGHWGLWEGNYEKDGIEINLGTPLVARNPIKDIVEGVIGIDFGTKSTVVVRQKNSFHNLPMRIGIGDISKKEEKSHYENPTMMEFIDYISFKKAYDKKIGRPKTQWENLVVSHSASNSMLESRSSDFNSYFGELKQWCGSKEKKIKIVDKKGYIEELPEYLKIEDGMDPIEIYAYYLGLYINNMHNGIYMKYYLSFPVTYELGIRNKIIDSYNKGLKKSLPTSLLNDDEVMKGFEVNSGASEPAAYAITALKEYGFEPIDDKKDFYGVFDFGGGTTDFDFGIWREGNGAKEKRFDYVIEHFGSGGDRYLGGENILELLAFEVFKKNREVLRKIGVSFTLIPECREFSGSEILLSNSREANLNMKTMMELLRPLWEKHEGHESLYKDGEIKVDLWKQDGEPLKKVELECNYEELERIIKERIEEGVKKFFNSLRLAFQNKKIDLNDIDKINIFLAGNSCKAKIVEEIFNEYIEKEVKKMEKNKNDIFSLYPPLGSEKAYEIQEVKGLKIDRSTLETPTGKTGVAFGLISSRKGSKIKVIDHNIDEDINFKYYLGEEKRGKFNVMVDRMIPYGKWIEFIDAGYEDFEILYSDNPIVSTNNIEVVDTSIKKKALKIDAIDEDAMVYIRKVSPTAIEYVVADEEGLQVEEYRGNITRIEIV